jgi:hypothetical protein
VWKVPCHSPTRGATNLGIIEPQSLVVRRRSVHSSFDYFISARPTDQLLFFVQAIAGDAKFDACSTQTIRKEDAQIAYD